MNDTYLTFKQQKMHSQDTRFYVNTFDSELWHLFYFQTATIKALFLTPGFHQNKNILIYIYIYVYMCIYTKLYNYIKDNLLENNKEYATGIIVSVFVKQYFVSC